MKKEEAVLTWNDKDGNKKAIAFSQLYENLSKVQTPFRSLGSDLYKDIYPGNVSIRDEYGRQDYDLYRPGDELPTKGKDIIRQCMKEYKGCGIVRNIIDLMSDFAIQGIDLSHPKKGIENFYKEWARRVDMPHVSERLTNYVLRCAITVVQRQTAVLPLKDSREMVKAEFEPKKREIPFGYSFFNPLSLEVLSADLQLFLGEEDTTYGIKVPDKVAQSITYPKDWEKQLIQKIPKEIISLIKKGQRVIPLDKDKVRAFYYKKDHWDIWPTPMLASVLGDLQMLRKMKQADIAALDGAISQIRIWKLGSLENKILPTEAAINKLANVLVNNMGGGIMDLIWGPDLEYQEANTSLHNFLGETKYASTLNQIFAGLGVPPLFSGSSNQGSFTNNFIAIKTLIERLNYLRSIIKKFWEYEVRLVQKAMGFKEPPSIVFDRMTLNDESAILSVMKELLDRNILSVETMQEMVGATPEIEQVRLKREDRARRSGRAPEKLTALQSMEDKLKVIFAQTGAYSPKDLGLELENGGDEKIPAKEEAKYAPKQVTPGVVNKKKIKSNGRPKNTKDSTKRKRKLVQPRTLSRSFVQVFPWAEDTQQFINDTLTPVLLKSVNKKNLRQLTTEQFEQFEKNKFAILCSLKPNQEVNQDIIMALYEKTPSNEFPSKLLDKVRACYMTRAGKELTTDRNRTLQSYVYAAVNSENYSKDEACDISDSPFEVV